ncbi:RNA polymerase II mediator complex protein Nut2 [Ascobolus immersus RN42]|uniref:Mediator of RNA polymerase II transcription subunit 10 n=1 Tax=Ascobolus immersus RN42 TaxID=1160509 RepID=A0A3N4IHJ3_ASCIM|nr:RNA polymerase II mediator complex protein Nut2 [Ascobolus immersus RN42]
MAGANTTPFTQEEAAQQALLEKLENDLRGIIGTLLETSIQTYTYAGSQSGESIYNHIKDLSSQLASPSLPPKDLTAALPQEVIAYVSQGRNPDIYTREFVELVQRSNQAAGGRVKAFGDFRDILADKILAAFPELKEDVERVIENTGGPRKK